MKRPKFEQKMDKQPPSKRRKVRKDTRSCSECKRRKIRCTFAAQSQSVCDGCRSRNVKCIGQEFNNKEDLTSNGLDVSDELEDFVGYLADQRNDKVPNLPSQDSHMGVKTKHSQQSAYSDGHNDGLSPHTLKPNLRNTPSPSKQIPGRYDELCHALCAVWPSQHDLDLMTRVDVGTSVLFHGIVCAPYPRFLSQSMPSPKDILQLPCRGCHPVLIARKLLMLGSFLQGMSPQSVEELNRHNIKCHKVMSLTVETASRLVTSNDSLTGSIEGIECIMIESMFQNNAGDLRGAWLTNRRAIAVAQMMRLHLGHSIPPIMLDADTSDRIEPEYMWARLVINDRYLSLMLGLPQSSPESPFATSQALERCAPMDRMERMESMIGSQILQCSRGDLHNIERTYEIDKLLQDAAALMPHEWWLAPDVTNTSGSDADTFKELCRLTNQFVHYNLLMRLHLPNMLLVSTDRKHDSSKITAINASREILLRFVRFRGSSSTPAYCRGVDFLAFVASTTLCIAYIDLRKQYQTGQDNYATVFHFLVHQRLGDRGLMERTLEIMEQIMQHINDAIACRIANILRRLLAIEAAATNGGCYKASLSSQAGEYDLLGTGHDERNDTLSIDIPHFGTIKFERSVLRYIPTTHHSEDQNTSSKSALEIEDSERVFHPESSSPLSRTEDLTKNETLIPLAFSNASQINQPSNEYRAMESAEEQCSLYNSLNEENPSQSEWLLNADDWILQGVDTALFNSLFSGLDSDL